ncbi:MAG: PfkB family carbohydrate kinase [Chthoniobacterales bacterium]
MSLLILGSVALDTVKTPLEEHAELFGGTASYATISASFFTQAHLVAIVGDDFPNEYLEDFKKRNIDLAGLQIVPGKTFRWSGEYFDNMNNRKTHSTDLNVFADFTPNLPESYRQLPFILLANIGPDLQLHVLDQLEAPRFVVADTMNLWINIARPDLLKLLARIDLLSLNDSEARELTGENNLIKAGSILRAMGPKYVAIKKGEHGCYLFGPDQFFSCPAFPLEDIHDPTGAGDAFAGGLAGYLASRAEEIAKRGEVDFEILRQALVYGSIMASFTVESFGPDRLRAVTSSEIEKRLEAFKALSAF